MRYFIAYYFLMFTLLCFGQSENQKVTVCHNGNSIEISVNALQSHLNHGDYQGSCNTLGVTDNDYFYTNISYDPFTKKMALVGFKRLLIFDMYGRSKFNDVVNEVDLSFLDDNYYIVRIDRYSKIMRL